VHTAGFVGFRPKKKQLHKWLIIVGWVEVRNPTLSMGLNPTFRKLGAGRKALELIDP
jgi:hypothetical protein